MFGYTNRDRIKHKDIRDKVGVTFVEDKMREARLRKFGDAVRCTNAQYEVREVGNIGKR